MNVKMLCGAAMLVLSGLMSQASAQADPSTIKIVNLTDFTTPSIQAKIVELAPAAFTKHLSAGKYALWTYTDTKLLESGNYCVAFIGLTHPVPPDKTARMPKTRVSQVTRAAKSGQMSDQEWNECKSDALIAAVKAFSGDDDWDVLAREADAVTSEKGARKAEAANFSQFAAFYSGKASDLEIPVSFTQAFDRRQLQLAVMSTGLVLGDELVCYASAGVTARAPDNRHPHYPGNNYTTMRVQAARSATADAKRQCEMLAAQQAVDSMLEAAWDESGMLKNFSATREQGVPLVTGPRQVRTKAPAPARNTNVTSVQRNTVSCHNQCSNGDCLRTFSDGRKERWQAPRVFNPLTNDWEWQVNSCGN